MGELDANASKARVRTYVWGLDLSGTMDGAGGVGGLLKVTDYVGGTTHHFVAYDGNGNVAALMDGGTGAVTARYDYGPFGEPLRATGTMALKNPLRFSTKYTDNQSGFLYYGYRFYSPTTGRWLNRDPLGQRAERNEYSFVQNAGTGRWDVLGLRKNSQNPLEDIFDMPPVDQVYPSDTEIHVSLSHKELCELPPAVPNVNITLEYHFATTSGHNNNADNGEVFVDGEGPIPFSYEAQDLPIILDIYRATFNKWQPRCPGRKVRDSVRVAVVYKPYRTPAYPDEPANTGVINVFHIEWSYTCNACCRYEGDFASSVKFEHAPPGEGKLPINP